MPNTLHQVFSLDEDSLTEFSPVPLFPLGSILELEDRSGGAPIIKFIYAKLDVPFVSHQPLVITGKGQEGQEALARLPYAITGNSPLLFIGVSQLDANLPGFVPPNQNDYMFFLIEGLGRLRVFNGTTPNQYLRLLATDTACEVTGTTFTNESRAVSLEANSSGVTGSIDALILNRAAEINP